MTILLALVILGCEIQPIECDSGYALHEDGSCADIDECAIDNGGCGDEDAYLCVNQDGTVPLCEYDPSSDYAAITAGVEIIESEGAYPSAIVVHGEEAFPIVLDQDNYTFIAGARSGHGKVIHFGHEAYLGSALYNTGDSDQLLLNAIEWAYPDGEPTIGIGSDLGTLADFLEGHHFEVQQVSYSSLDSVDIYFSLTYEDLIDHQYTKVQDYVANGGSLFTAGHAWYWGYSNDNAAENHPGNRMIWDSGLTISTQYAIGGSDEVSEAIPIDLFHASHGLDLLASHVEGSTSLSLEDQLIGVDTVGLAVATLPLSFTEYYDRALVFVEDQAPVIPTPKSPLVKSEEPIHWLSARVAHKLASESPPNEITSHPASEDFPGVVDSKAERVTWSVPIHGSYEGRPWQYIYSNPASPVFRSTGLYAAPGEVVSITLPSTAAGTGLTALIGGHTDTLWHLDSIERFPEIIRDWPLNEEVTEIGSAFGGLVYITVPEGLNLGDIFVSISNAVPSPKYVHGETDLADWQNTIRYFDGPWAEFISDKFILTVQSTEVKAIDNPSDLMDFWDALLDGDADLSAISRDRVRPERIMLDQQISAGWMHSGYPIMAYTAVSEELLSVDSLFKSGSWGAFHELGHNHQHDGWLLPGTTETTCNLFSVYGMEEVVGIDRSVGHGALDDKSRAERTAAYIANGANFENDWSVWTALETYLQIQEAFGWQPFKDIFAEYLDMPSSQAPNSDQERIDEWVFQSSQAVEMNLGPFYTAWGFPISEDVLDTISIWPEWTDHPLSTLSD